MASLSLPPVMTWQALDAFGEAVWRSSVKAESSVTVSSSSSAQFGEDSYASSSQNAQNALSPGGSSNLLAGNHDRDSLSASNSIEVNGEFTSGIFIVGYEANGTMYAMGQGSVTILYQASSTTTENASSLEADTSVKTSYISSDGYVTQREDASILSSVSVSNAGSSGDASFQTPEGDTTDAQPQPAPE